MKYPLLRFRPGRSAGFPVVLFVFPLGLAGAVTPAAPTAPTTHVLFMGADITVEKDKAFHLVADVTPTDLIIKPGGKPVKLPLTQTTDLKINEALKLTAASAGIDHLSAERAYSANADPFLGLARSTALSAGESATSDLANGARLRESLNVAGANAMAIAARATNEPPAIAKAEANLAEVQAVRDAAESTVTEMHNTPQAEAYNVGSQSVKAGAEENFDAIRLTFEVTAKNEMAQPYYAVIAQIRDHDSKPGQVRKWAFVRALGPMSPGEVKNVTVYRGGFPPGYILEGCEVHLYNRGAELATNLSRKRVPLTDDEAQEYRVFEYIGDNKGRTLPAAVVPETLPDAMPGRFSPAQLAATSHLRVAKTGAVAGAFQDAAGQKPLQDPALELVLLRLRFNPALKDGKPVETIVPVRLGQQAAAVKADN